MSLSVKVRLQVQSVLVVVVAVNFKIMACKFSFDGKYFAQISLEGKLRIWNTLSNSFEQEFTPDYNLTSPLTCLHFIQSDPASKIGTPQKKKRKNSQSDLNLHIALGTASGHLLFYSVTKADSDFIIDSTIGESINCLSSLDDEYVYSGTDNNIIVWNLAKRNISSKWVAGEKITAILAVSGTNRLITASKTIKLWDLKSKDVLKVYTGHSSQVSLLYCIPPKDGTGDTYFISGSKGDRLLNCWSLNKKVDGKNAITSFLMEDIVNNLSACIDQDGSTHIAATVRSGVVHVYQHTINGKKNSKPVKPKTTVQVVADSRDKTVSPILISAAKYRDAQTLCIGYGSAVVLTFESITISSYQKIQVLLREDLHKKTTSKEKQVSKVQTPIVGNDVHYLSSQTSSATVKRKNDGQQEVPMEKRLENLIVNESDSNSKVPKANNVAQLLIQGLHSKESNILKTVLLKKDEELIANTIKRLPMTVIVPLTEELTKLIQGKTLSRKIGLIWLKNLLLIHSGVLLSNPDLPDLLGQILGNIESGLELQIPRYKLIGRLELLMSQISLAHTQDSQDNENSLLIFNDKGSGSDSENDVLEFEDHSNSENEWEEENSDQENSEPMSS